MDYFKEKKQNKNKMDMNHTDIYRNLNPPAIVRLIDASELERIAQEQSAANIALRNFYDSIIKELVQSLRGTNPLVYNDENGKAIEVYRNKKGGLIAGVIYDNSGDIEYIINYRRSGTIVIYMKKDVFQTNYNPLKPEYVDSIVPDRNQVHDNYLKKSLERHIQKLRKKDEGKKATS